MPDPQPRSVKISDDGIAYRRAVAGDLEFGHICPVCAGPKTDQALRCRSCFCDAISTHGLTRKGVMRYATRRSEARIVNYHGPGT